MRRKVEILAISDASLSSVRRWSQFEERFSPRIKSRYEIVDIASTVRLVRINAAFRLNDKPDIRYGAQ